MTSTLRPGRILLEQYLKPMGISQMAMARAIGVNPGTINAIVNGKRSITPAMSMRFGAFFGHYEDFWHNLQVEHDFSVLRGQAEHLIRHVQTAKGLMSNPR